MSPIVLRVVSASPFQVTDRDCPNQNMTRYHPTANAEFHILCDASLDACRLFNARSASLRLCCPEHLDHEDERGHESACNVAVNGSDRATLGIEHFRESLTTLG
jgi:hypothetical protein